MTGATFILVLGVPHSATTILYRMLALHPDVGWSSQYSFRSGELPGRVRIPFAHQIDRLLRVVVAGHDWRKRPPGIAAMVLPKPMATAGLWAHLLPKRESAASGEERIRTVRTVIGRESLRLGRPFYITKLARIAGTLPVVQAAFPHARFVHIVRDGRAVALSLRPKFVLRGANPEEALRAAAQRWLDDVETVNRDLPPTALCELTYEALCDDAHGTLTRAIAHAGLDPARFPFDLVPRTLMSTNARRLGGASAEDLSVVEVQQRARLQAYGYLPLEGPPGARDRSIDGMRVQGH